MKQIESRLVQTSRAAAGDKTLISINKSSKLWGYSLLTAICGKPVDEGLVKLPETWGPPSITQLKISHPVLADDLPYFIVVTEFVLFALLAGRRLIAQTKTYSYGQLFFLGAGFLIMELACVARLSLLFGTTWLTSAVVINGILLLVYLANNLVLAQRTFVEPNQKLIYIVTLASLVVSSLLPNDMLLKISNSVQYVGPVVMVALTLMPICLASLIFPIAFARAASPPRALAVNLRGSFFGGLLEYLSFLLGNSGLIILAASLYLASMVCYLLSLKENVSTVTDSSPAEATQL